MIKSLRIQNFKQFRDKTFTFNPSGITLLAGGNNSGKSSLLQALAIWEFCKSVVNVEVGAKALIGPYRGHGIPVSAENFSPLSLPALNHLWTNLKPGYLAGQPNSSYTLRIGCKWDERDSAGVTAERGLVFGLSLAQDRVYIKPLESTLIVGSQIPKLAYLPPFAGISTKEEKLSTAAQERLIGRGLAGATLRNSIHFLFDQSAAQLKATLAGRKNLRREERRTFSLNDPWSQLLEVLERVFKASLRLKPFDERYHTSLVVQIFKGDWVGARFEKHRGYNPRDIMVEGGGFLQWLSVYSLAVKPGINVLLLDEPDAHLHPSLQAHLMDRLGSLARANNKQVLLATHSTEILRKADHRTIYEMGARGNRYLVASEQRVGLFAGIGTEYSPKIDQLREYRKLIFVEGSFDESVLRAFAERLAKPLPVNLVFWQYSGEHSQRRILFEQLRIEFPNIEGMSLRDRDNLDLAKIGQNLTLNDHPDADGLRFRTWRRRQIEGYLLLPAAISRAAKKSEPEIVQFLTEQWNFVAGADFKLSHCPPGLLDARGKEILSDGLPARGAFLGRPSIESQYGCARHDIAAAFEVGEVPDDIRLIIDELHTMCQVGRP